VAGMHDSVPRWLRVSGMALVSLGVLLGTQSPSADTNDLRPPADRLSPLPVTAVRIRDAFWAPRIEVNRTRTLDHVLKEIESTGGLRNFDIAAGSVGPGSRATGTFGGPFWADSDVYKWIEGASLTLATHPDPALDAKVDGIIARIAAAQQPDGYLDTFIQIAVPDMRFKNFAFFHEDFSSGHLFEAAVAHYQSTGKKTLLTVATRLADLFDKEFGPGKQDYIPGHEGIELALVKLSRVTGEKRYLDLAKAMVDRRGQKPSIFERQFKQLDPNRTVDFLGKPLRFGEWYERFYLKDPRKFDTRYAQDHLPVREQKEAVGHAVRAMFLYCAMADLVYETSDAGLWDASKALHDSVTLHRMYVTGGIGPSEHNEGFTEDYDLPNENAYQETCASAAMVLWNHRLFTLTGDAKYTDVMEQSLYNAVAAGVSLTGDLFCYATPLASRGDFKRSPWFGVPCCPTTISRFLPSLGQYIYSRSPDGLWVNLFIASEATTPLGSGPDSGKVTLQQISNYPWEGGVKINVTPDAPREFTLHVRLPGWASKPTIRVNGSSITPQMTRGYAAIKRQWKSGDSVELSMPMEVQRLAAHPKVLHAQGKIALRRGPLFYAFEQADNQVSLRDVVLPAGAAFRSQFDPALAGGAVKVTTEGLVHDAANWDQRLYQPVQAPASKRVPLTAVPYAIWGNRGLGEMIVWIDASQ
jgi:DUF1680 family protein